MRDFYGAHGFDLKNGMLTFQMRPIFTLGYDKEWTYSLDGETHSHVLYQETNGQDHIREYSVTFSDNGKITAFSTDKTASEFFRSLKKSGEAGNVLSDLAKKGNALYRYMMQDQKYKSDQILDPVFYGILKHIQDLSGVYFRVDKRGNNLMIGAFGYRKADMGRMTVQSLGSFEYKNKADMAQHLGYDLKDTAQKTDFSPADLRQYDAEKAGNYLTCADFSAKDAKDAIRVPKESKA